MRRRTPPRKQKRVMQPESLDRLNHPNMEYYRETYKDSERWNGVDSIEGKTVLVYCEQGYGDIIQFARYIPKLKQKGCKVILHCPETLHRIFGCLGVDGMHERYDDNLPEHDYHAMSMSLPFHFDDPSAEFPYLTVDETKDLSELELGDCFKVGIAWEGNPNHSNNKVRCCPLIKYKRITDKFPNVKLFTLQKAYMRRDLLVGADTMELYASAAEDFYDTGMLVNAMDAIITIDTSILHLCGAMNKQGFGLLSTECDPRWELEGVNWYPSIKMIQQDRPKDWDGVFDRLEVELNKIIG